MIFPSVFTIKIVNVFSLSTHIVIWGKGDTYQAIQSLINNEKEVTWGNSATFSNIDPETFAHEFSHII